MALTRILGSFKDAILTNVVSSSAQIASDISGSFISKADKSAISGSIVGGVSGSAASTGSFGDVALRKGGKVKFSDASYIALSGSSISAPGEGIDMVANNLLALNIDDTGAVTKPLQPGFAAVGTGAQENATTQTIVEFTDTSSGGMFDNGDCFSEEDGNGGTNKFTAPVSGVYQININVNWMNFKIDNDYYYVNIVTSNKGYSGFRIDPAMFAQDSTVQGYSMGGSVLTAMDVNDTAHITIYQDGNDINADVANTQCWFSAILVA
jgi:hypothetical protein